MGLQGVGSGALIAFGVVVLAVVGAAACVCGMVYVFAAPAGRRGRSLSVLKTLGKCLFAVFTVALVVDYALDVRLRSRAHDCERKPSDDGKYIAELCLLRDNGHDADYVGRVYDAKDGELVVERTFDAAEPELSWLNGQVSFMRVGENYDVVRLAGFVGGTAAGRGAVGLFTLVWRGGSRLGGFGSGNSIRIVDRRLATHTRRSSLWNVNDGSQGT
ncbi:MAG: hypothetical protein CPSOU_2537 [uncultured Paraburkholderia sp.]|nr:MAG: hypothetical protein CPSOU_2537 [uncultured Paraburkholderia sp.]